MLCTAYLYIFFKKPKFLHLWYSTFSQTSRGFYTSAVQVLKKTLRKGEIALNKHFLLFPQCFKFEELSSISIKFEIIVCKFFQFG